jgi:hypothetical protein
MDERRERRSRLRSWSGDIASWTSRLQRTVTSRGGPVSARLYRSMIMPAEDLKEGDARKLAAARQAEATDSYPESQRAQQGASLQFYMTILFAAVM